MRLIMAILISYQASATTVLVQGPGTSPLEYQAALKADPDAVSPSRQALKLRPLAASREKLQQAFASAQKSFLEKSEADAAEKYRLVTAMLTSDDWDLGDRILFLHAYLRLAQLLPESSDLFLAQAQGCGDDVQPEPGLFPPPLLEKFRAIKTANTRVAVPPGWQTVLINGYPCGMACLGIPVTGEKVRLTFLSDIWQSVTQILDPAQLRHAKIDQVPIASGSCSEARVNLPGARVFWGLDCEGPLPKALDFKPVVRTGDLPKFEIRERGTQFYKSKWFWGGVVVAAAAALVINGQRHHKQEREPTTTYGYQ